MLSPLFFVNLLKKHEIDFYSGVPDSLLKNLCAYITYFLPKEQNIIAANEGGAMGVAVGYHLSSRKIPVVYMQNSGEGNIINPLASLTDKDVYNIPVLLLIGWRGFPGLKDEPQHIKQGKVTTGLLNIMGVNYTVLSKKEETAVQQIKYAVDYMKTTNECYALVIEKDTFEEFVLDDVNNYDLSMSRESAICTVANSIESNSCVVSTTGMISRELFEFREKKCQTHSMDFLTVGSMGHASQIALGIALQIPNRRIYCFDGDGAFIMHMGSIAITASMQPKNYIHVLFNNGAHDSVGGQPTVGLNINIPSVAKAVGYRYAISVDNAEDLGNALNDIKTIEGPILLEVKVKKGNRKDLGRPTTTPIQNKEALMEFLKEN